MRDNEFYIVSMLIAILAIVAMALIAIGYWIDYREKVIELIKIGVPPVEAICALQNDYGKNPTCLIRALKEDSYE